MEILESCRRLGALGREEEQGIAESLLKSIGKAAVTNGVQCETLAAIIEDAKVFTTDGGLIKINGVSPQEFEQLVREGNLIKLAKSLKSSTFIDNKAQRSFSRLIEQHTPEVQLAELDEVCRVQKSLVSININLNVSAANGEELAKQLDASSKTILERIYNKIKMAAGTTGQISLFFGTLYLGFDMYSSLADYLRERNGCYLVKKNADNGSISCFKVQNKSCSNENFQNTSKSSSVNFCSDDQLQIIRKTNVNPLIFILDTIKGSSMKKSSSIFASIKTKFNNTRDFHIDKKNALNLLKDTKFQNAVEQVMIPYLEKVADDDKKKDLSLFRMPCSKLPNYRGKCICCDPSAPKDSPEYVSSRLLPINYTLKCVRDSKLIDVIVEASVKLKKNLLDEGTSILQSLAKFFHIHWVIYMLIVIGLLIFGTITTRFILTVKKVFLRA